MGSDVVHGVVDHRGRVYDPTASGVGVHQGLYVMDAAVIPTAVGVNPLLTISALAERAADHFGGDGV
jgi:cholesterol oxidase